MSSVLPLTRRLHVGTDHAGFDLLGWLVPRLEADGLEVVRHGAHALDPDDDYPAPCIRAARAVVGDPGSLGLVLGGSGNGEQMAANLVPGVRAALVWDERTAELARRHNDANVASVGARQHTPDEVLARVRRFLATPFSGEARHQRRIDAMAAYERSRDV